jgi:hypothetical protein
MQRLKTDSLDLQVKIRTAMTTILGEMPAVAALAYTGDAEDGDLIGFVKRAEELFGNNAPILLNNIVMMASKSN